MDQIEKVVNHLQQNSLVPADFAAQQANASENFKFTVALSYYLSQLDNERTRQQYASILYHFTRFMANVAGKSPLSTIGIDVTLWKYDLLRTGGVAGCPEGVDTSRYNPQEKTSINKKLACLSAFYTFLQQPGMDGSPPLVQYNPVNALKSRFKVDKYSRSKKISKEAFKKILHAIDTNTEKGLRDYCLIAGYFLTGRRNTEWLSLRWGQINFNTRPVTFSFVRKGEKDTIDQIPDYLLRVMFAYLTKKWGEDFSRKMTPETYIFTSMKGRGRKKDCTDANQHMTQRGMLKMIKKYAKDAGLDPEKITVHSLRHLHAQSYLELGASVEEIRGRLHHQSLATTQQYLTALDSSKNRLAKDLENIVRLEDGLDDPTPPC